VSPPVRGFLMNVKKRLATGVALAATGLCVVGVGAWATAATVYVPPVKACANSSGVLVLASGSGACATGQTKVTLGHGAYPISFHASTTLTSATKTIVGYGYHETCTITGSGSSRSVNTQLIITGKPGVTYTVEGPVMEQLRTSLPPSIDSSPITTVTDNFTQQTSTTVLFVPTTAGHFYRLWYDLTVVGADNSVQQVRFRVTSNNLGTVPTGERRCMVDGTILPT
jgi:hypothetical protein